MSLPHFGTLSAKLTEKNIRMFAKEVLPALRELDDRQYAGFELPKAKAAAAAMAT